MNMNRRIAMGKVRTSGCALVLFSALVFFASSALGQAACLPVVYAFRHAEDTNPKPPPLFALTPTGQAHALLYPGMISELESRPNTNYCPVAKVYATTKVRKKGECATECDSATNAFDTAKPLATAVMSADPITTVGTPVNQLYEYLGNGNNAPDKPNYSTVTATALRTELLKTANDSKSSAIFWTSQGLHVLGGAIINADSNVPEKNGGAIPPRNAVYIFVANGSAPNIARFYDTPMSSTLPVPSSVFVQCFNHVEPSSQFDPDHPTFIAPAGNPPTQLYYCGYNSDQANLGGNPGKSCNVNAQCGTIPNDQNKNIKGKICATEFLLGNTAGPSIFGACD
jgi:hypothetical protein